MSDIISGSELGGHSQYRLVRMIIGLSYSDQWNEAKTEWNLHKVFISGADQPGTCLCGHFPIRKHCLIVNRVTDKSVVVGSVCIEHFMGLGSGAIFRGLELIARDPKASLNPALIAYCISQNWLNDWEIKFTKGRKPELTERILTKRKEINEKVLRLARATRGEVGGA